MTGTPGEQLRKAREDQELTLDEIAEELHIRTRYLAALEEDNLEAIPSNTQARGFLRTYANHLGLPALGTISKTEENEPVDTDLPDPAVSPKDQDIEVPHQLIFKEIGENLRERRDILGLSLEDVEAHTRIPAHYVQFIESGAFDQFPSPAQSRGMLNNYLQFLDIKSSNIMARYAEALQTSLVERQSPQIDSEPEDIPQPTLRRKIKLPQWARMFLSPDLFLITGIGIIVVGLTIWGIGRVTRTRAEQSPLPTAPSLVEALLPTPTELPTDTPPPQTDLGGELLDVSEDQAQDTPTPTFQVSGTSIQLFLIIRQRAYLHITVDGEVAFDGRTSPNTNLTFLGHEEISLLTGNAAAFQVYYNDQDLGVLGIFGEVVEVFYTREEIIRPTKLPTTTPSPTILLSETPEPTSTPSGVELPPEPNTPVP